MQIAYQVVKWKSLTQENDQTEKIGTLQSNQLRGLTSCLLTRNNTLRCDNVQVTSSSSFVPIFTTLLVDVNLITHNEPSCVIA